ncbi:MAG: hypothetical protein IKG19_08030, partial [Lachnospiraceae bacterium]|nr:hypothetical protein [Lachnospiraceae bacterium]
MDTFSAIVSISTPFDLEEETNSPSSGDNNLTDSNPNIEASSSHIQNSAKEPSIPEPLIHNAPTEYGFKEFIKDGSKMLFQYIKSHPGEALLKVVSVALTVAPLFSGNSSKGTSRQSSASSNIVSDDVQNTIKE